MNSLILCSVFLFTPPNETVSARFEFHDASTHAGRDVLHFRMIELGPTPVRPLTFADPPQSGARHGLVLVGPGPDAGLSVVSQSAGDDDPCLWLDANGDGHLDSDEQHRFTEKEIEVAALIASEGAPERNTTADPLSSTSNSHPDSPPLRRTLLFRRSALGDGLRWAVRGYTVGTLRLGEDDLPAFLVDANADGLFDSAGEDRLWIDLDRNGRFDGLTEQWPVGSPVRFEGRLYLVAPDAQGTRLSMRQRASEAGRLQLSLAGRPHAPASDVAIGLVSDLGELIEVRRLNAPVSLPAGDYRVVSLWFEMRDANLNLWSYFFRGAGEAHLSVRPNEETTAALLTNLSFQLAVKTSVGDPGREPTLAVTPRLQTPYGLYLASCRRVERFARDPDGVAADIQLQSESRVTLDQASSGFR